MTIKALKPDIEQIDVWMSGNVANTFTNSFVRKHNGAIPTNTELSAHIDSISPLDQVALVQSDPALNGLAVHLKNSADVLRWVKIVRDRPSTN